MQSTEHLSRLEPIVILSTFSQFISSSYFSQWLASNRADVSNVSCERLATEPVDESANESERHIKSADANKLTGDSEFVEVSISGWSTTGGFGKEAANGAVVPACPPSDQFSDTAVSYLDKVDFDRIIRSESWLSTLLMAAECLPVPFSMASAGKRGFPIIYTNPRFEALTGYRKRDIIGQNCKFLQQCSVEGKSEEDRAIMDADAMSNERKLIQLRGVLADGKPATIELVNYRRDGSMFRNYILLKPIFDQHKHYRYVIGLQFEVKDGDSGYNSEQKMSNRNLFNLLPDQLIIDDEEESEY
jgi:PAS domain S-box-containing protein